MISQSALKNVILDLGGVLVDINPRKTSAAMKRILRPEVFDSLHWNEMPEIVTAVETGKWSKHEFVEYIRKQCKPGVIQEEVVDAWCAMILEFPHHRVEMVKSLAEKYDIFLLSNTNPFHIKYFEKEFKNRYHFSLHKLFKRVYYSSDIGYRKPDAECYHFVLNDAGLLAGETILVDDREENCNAAAEIGIRALKVPENSGLEAVINQLVSF